LNYRGESDGGQVSVVSPRLIRLGRKLRGRKH